MKIKIKFYTLAFFIDNEQRLIMKKYRKDNEKVDIFIKNAILLDKSLKWFGSDSLTLLTNNEEKVLNSFKRLGYSINYKVINFDFNVPIGIPYYSSHFKIDVFKYLSQTSELDYNILLDNDVIQLYSFTEFFKKIVESNIPIIYLRSLDSISKDNSSIFNFLIRNKPSLPTLFWTGGEFWGGNSKFFQKLYNQCILESKSYFKDLNYNNIHIGDEALTSLAISELWNNGLKFADASRLNFIKRYSGMHEVNKISQIHSIFFHLPVDKLWIYNLFLDNLTTPEKFIKKYNKHYNLYHFFNKTSRLINLKKQQKNKWIKLS